MLSGYEDDPADVRCDFHETSPGDVVPVAESLDTPMITHDRVAINPLVLFVLTQREIPWSAPLRRRS